MQVIKILKKVPWKKMLIATFLGSALILIVSYIFGLYYKHPTYIHPPSILATIILAAIIIEGIQFINGKIDVRLSWSKSPNKRFWFQLVTNLVFTIIMLSGFGTIISLYVANDPSVNIYDLIIINTTGIVFIAIYVCIELIVFLLKNWRGSLVEIERFKIEMAEAKLESLKNQLSPHFLFNNLNTLYGLIKEDKNLASDYLLKLSEIYRYVLKLKDTEVVTLDEELNFIKDYVYLLSTRYGSNFKVDFQIKQQLVQEKFLPPFTLQLLVENAEKHNVIDDDMEMQIRIFSENDDTIVVENSLSSQPITNKSTNVGLKNLNSRYQFLTDEKVVIKTEANKFIVKVPLLDEVVVT